MSEGDRASMPGAASPLPTLTEYEIALREVENGLRQFDRVVELIDDATKNAGKPFKLRPSTIMELNELAVSGLEVTAGCYRQVSIEISGTQHVPPDERDVPRHVDHMCDYIEEHWESESAIHLCAYMLWRLNWIHPFENGNGRTSRASGYLVLCAKLGYRLPGVRTIPDRIADDKGPYYSALDAADAVDIAGGLDVSKMETLVEELLAAQLVSVFNEAKSPTDAPQA
jgi:Fic family protein